MKDNCAEKLSFQQTVPCSLAHRRALGEVFIADSLQASETEFYLAVQVPRAHSLWFDRQVAYYDPFSGAEAARQGSFVVVHRYLGVPEELPFTLQRFEFQVRDLPAYQDNERSPLEGVLRFQLSDVPPPATQLGSLSFEGDMTIGDSLAMVMNGDIVFVPKNDYEALRAFQRKRKPIEHAARPVPVRRLEPALVGRMDQRNVVIGQPAEHDSRYPLVVDQTHPSFFDHSYDHIPGPLIVEGFRQAAIVTAHKEGLIASPIVAATGAAASFSDFAEFETTPKCSAKVDESFADGRVSVVVGLHQFGNGIAEGRIELTPYPRGEQEGHDG